MHYIKYCWWWQSRIYLLPFAPPFSSFAPTPSPSHLEEVSKVCEDSDFDVVDILGAVLLEHGQDVTPGDVPAQNTSHLVQGEGQHSPDLPLDGGEGGHIEKPRLILIPA